MLLKKGTGFDAARDGGPTGGAKGITEVCSRGQAAHRRRPVRHAELKSRQRGRAT
ncbi:hypothetical protein ACL2XO_03235 [Sodalis sp. RH15]|uniref:hypothetical protein n=1 Tax=Sodalis sp. RH15 TaxID=3394330 RepID=UPI0039B6E029